MNVSKIKTDFTKNGYSDNELALIAGVVVKDLTGNIHFPTLAPDIEIINQKNETYKDLLSLAKEGTLTIIAQKRVARKELEIVLRNTAFKVTEISGGNEAILLSSGFDLCKKRSPVGMLEPPEDIIVERGIIKGSITIRCKVIKHAYNYMVLYSKSPNTPYNPPETVISSKHTITIYNLISHQDYEVQIAGIGACPNIVWSEKVVGCAR